MKELFIILYNFFKTKYFHNFKSKEKLKVWQDKKIKKFKKKVLVKSPFYKNYINYNLSSFPIMNKQLMMENFDMINTKGIKKSDAMKLAIKGESEYNFSTCLNSITIGLSSGTSGNRGIFLADYTERFKWAGIILAKTLPKSIFKSCKVAFFLRINSSLYTSVQKNKKIHFKFFPLHADLHEHIQKLNNYQPDLLVAPAQMLRLLAKKIREKKLKISLKKVISVAEVLDPLDEKYLEDSFKLPIHQIYQCTEGFLAYTCKYGSLHLNEDLLFIEKKWIDKKNRRFSPIITDFTRTTQPIVRYHLNDILVEKKEPCPCGNVFCAIEKIEGRCDDIFYFICRKTKKLKPVFPDYIRRLIISASENILDYHVIQHDIDRIEISLLTDQKFLVKKQIMQNFKKFFEKIKIFEPKIQFNNNFNKKISVKLRRIENRSNKRFI